MRNAQAIAKVCVAALGAHGKWVDCRRANRDRKRCAGSASLGRDGAAYYCDSASIRALLALGRKTAAAEILPIDDIRSTASYRSAVAGNLVAEFLERLGATGRKR